MLQAEQVFQGRYQLHRQLGKNAGRQTWLAEDLLSQNPVIVKLLAFSPQMQWEEFKLFEREAQVLKQLSHPRIPRYRDYFSVDKQAGSGLCWFGLVQDYIAGNSLQQLLDAGKHFTKSQVRSIATGMHGNPDCCGDCRVRSRTVGQTRCRSGGAQHRQPPGTASRLSSKTCGV